jgi:hypothetical protein
MESLRIVLENRKLVGSKSKKKREGRSPLFSNAWKKLSTS